MISFFFFLYCSADHRHLHSFPTRRSSDLSWPIAAKQPKQPGRAISSACTITVPSPSETAFHRAKSLPSPADRKSTRLNSSHVAISYAVFCLKKKKKEKAEDNKK